MSSENSSNNIPDRLKDTAKLSPDQVATVMDWLSENENKKVKFTLMFRKQIEMKVEGGIVDKEEFGKEDFDIQHWAWQIIKRWMGNQEQ